MGRLFFDQIDLFINLIQKSDLMNTILRALKIRDRVALTHLGKSTKEMTILKNFTYFYPLSIPRSPA
jgi:hypothetical protein